NEPFHTSEQNDIISDDNDIYIHRVKKDKTREWYCLTCDDKSENTNNNFVHRLDVMNNIGSGVSYVKRFYIDNEKFTQELTINLFLMTNKEIGNDFNYVDNRLVMFLKENIPVNITNTSRYNIISCQLFIDNEMETNNDIHSVTLNEKNISIIFNNNY